MRLRAELQPSGCDTLPARGAAEAVRLIASSQRIQLAIVRSTRGVSDAPGEQQGAQHDPDSSSVRCEEQENFRMVAAVASVAAANHIPVLLISSVWNDSAAVWALRTGADYFLFAPYQAED